MTTVGISRHGAYMVYSIQDRDHLHVLLELQQALSCLVQRLGVLALRG